METIKVIFDFGCYFDNRVKDFIVELPLSAIPRKGESIGFDREQLTVTDNEDDDFLEDNRFLQVNDVTWYYSNRQIRDVRIYLEELKD